MGERPKFIQKQDATKIFANIYSHGYLHRDESNTIELHLFCMSTPLCVTAYIDQGFSSYQEKFCGVCVIK